MEMNPSSSDVGTSEDVVKALLEYLVDPMLPLKSSAQEAPSISQLQSVAKQVHAVVLLYNYYQRKQHPEMDFLGLESFCMLAVTMKPTLIAHMKLMQRSFNMELDDLENQLSVTEKAILDACNICLTLDVSKDVPCIEEWPISKVAVLLVDSRKENCLLQFSSVTHGVWSVLEKDLDISNISLESTVVGKHLNKRKRIKKKTLMEEHDADEAGFHQLALSAVKEATGIDQADLMVLESHVVYSLSKEKTAARFYIVQGTQSINEALQVPIKDAIESLQGPLVKKSSGSWTVTPVVEYFHVLPYAGIVSDWLSRKVCSNSLEDLSVGSGNVDVNRSQRAENTCDKEVSERKEVFFNTMQNIKAGLEIVNFDSSQRTENPYDKEVAENLDRSDKNYSIAESIGNGASGVNSPRRRENNIDRSVKNCSIAESIGNRASGVKSPQRRENSSDKEVVESTDRSDKHCGYLDTSGKEARCANTESPKQKDNGCRTIGLFDSSSGPHNMDVDDASLVFPQNDDKGNNTRMAGKVYHHQKKKTFSTESNIHAWTSSGKHKAEVANTTLKSTMNGCGGEKVDAGNKTCRTILSDEDGMSIGDPELVPFQLNAKSPEKLLLTLAAKENGLSQTALRVLLRKREKLSHQLRNLEDEIALCDKNIQTILNGGEDNMALNIEVVIDCCNDVCLQGKAEAQDRIYQHVEDKGPRQYVKGNRLSEASLTLGSVCQELDDVCNANNWMLPTYRIWPSDGGFVANVVVKGLDFECSSGSELYPNPREARESAAAQMIAKIRSQAK